MLLLRFSTLVPDAPVTDPNPGCFLENFARTLTEALRFAAAELLEIQAQELRASFRLNGRFIEVILYDAIAGGAGYCIRLRECISIHALLKQAAQRLDCERACSGGCRACLCDYSNQRF